MTSLLPELVGATLRMQTVQPVLVAVEKLYEEKLVIQSRIHSIWQVSLRTREVTQSSSLAHFGVVRIVALIKPFCVQDALNKYRSDKKTNNSV